MPKCGCECDWEIEETCPLCQEIFDDVMSGLDEDFLDELLDIDENLFDDDDNLFDDEENDGF